MERFKAEGKLAVDLSGEPLEKLKAAMKGEPIREKFSNEIKPYTHIVYTTNEELHQIYTSTGRRIAVLIRTFSNEHIDP
jgi:hypothetical protein